MPDRFSPREAGNGADDVRGAEPWLLAGVAIAADLVACAGGLGSVVRSAGLIDQPVAVEFAGAPLRLYERGMWIPGDEYWGEPGDAVQVPHVEAIAGGARRGYEFEQLLPGGDDPDVIGEALALRDRGQLDRANALLQGVAAWDPRRLDAHAHLGLLAFDEGHVERRSRVTRPASGWPSRRCLRTSIVCSRGGGLTTARLCAARTG